MKKPAYCGIGLGIACLLTLPCLAQSNAETDKTIACSYDNKQPMTSGEAKLSVKDKKINRIWFNSYYPGGRGELGFTCHIDLNREDQAYAWRDNGPGVIVTAKETGDSLQLNRGKKGFSLDFANFKTLSAYCGAGAAMPSNVFIPFAGKSCKVSLPRRG
jgi:hypothetical protein